VSGGQIAAPVADRAAEIELHDLVKSFGGLNGPRAGRDDGLAVPARAWTGMAWV
jgi:hypothetical protein